MIVGRTAGWLFCFSALVLIGWDVAGIIATEQYATMTLGQLWALIDRPSINLAQAVVQRYIWPELWDPVIVWVLLRPAWLVFGGLGLALVLGFRRRRAPEAEGEAK